MARRKNISKSTRTILAMLRKTPRDWQYGYEISKLTQIKSGVLYPILMRLHEQGLLESEWREPDKQGHPPRHVYRLTTSGILLANEQAADETLPPLNLPKGLNI